jgi:hypothetical protein
MKWLIIWAASKTSRTPNPTRLLSNARQGIHFLKRLGGKPVSERKRTITSAILRAMMKNALNVPAG